MDVRNVSGTDLISSFIHIQCMDIYLDAFLRSHALQRAYACITHTHDSRRIGIVVGEIQIQGL